MTSNTIYHYVYRITNTEEKKHYYGKRSSKIDPRFDLGIKYFSSSSDKEFRADQKNNPENYKYKVVGKFNTARAAITRESELHTKFDVGVNPKFFNKQNKLKPGLMSPEFQINLKELNEIQPPQYY